MASFMSNFFPAGKEKASDALGRPSTPTKTNSFVEPSSTPQGSPSKRTAPPGAYDLPTAFDSAMNLKTAGVEAPLKLTRPQSVITTPQSPGKTRSNPLDEASPNVDDSVIHKGPSSSSPTKKQGQENTPPAAARLAAGSPAQHNHAAMTRQQLYEPRERPSTPAAKRFNTTRPLSAEERELLNKPHVKRLVNVTQLCECPMAGWSKDEMVLNLHGAIQISLIITSISSHTWAQDRIGSPPSSLSTRHPPIRTSRNSTRCGPSMPDESEQTFGRDEFDFDTATSRFSHKSARVATVRSSSRRRRIPAKSAP